MRHEDAAAALDDVLADEPELAEVLIIVQIELGAGKTLADPPSAPSAS